MNMKSVAQALRDLADAIEEDDAAQELKAAPKKRRPADDADDEPAPKKRKPAAEVEDDEPAPKPKKKPRVEDDGDDRDYEKDIRPLITGLSKDCGREVALEVLEKFEDSNGDPCTKGAQVDPADWDRLLKEIKKARAKHEAD